MPGLASELTTVYRRNGRTIRIPVQKASPQLPVAQEEPRPLLAEKTACEEVEAQAKDWQEQALRWRAEAENVRKRADRRAEVQIQRERRRLLSHLLTVADNLERALAHADGDASLHAGVKLTLDDLRAVLAQEGVAPIEALGRRFDPNLHEAVSTDGSGGDRVAQVLRTGYTLDGELLRPARVVVGRASRF